MRTADLALFNTSLIKIFSIVNRDRNNVLGVSVLYFDSHRIRSEYEVA